MRAPRHYLLLVYLHSSKEKRETQISLTNSLLLVFRSLSFHQKSLFCSSLLQLSFFTIFCEKNANSIKIPLFSVSKTFAKKIRHLNSRGQRRKKREEKNLQRIDFFRATTKRLYSLETLSSKKSSSKRRACLHTHACTHTHTHFCLSLSRSVNCPSTVVVVVVVSSVVCSRPLSLSFLVRKKKGEETEDD